MVGDVFDVSEDVSFLFLLWFCSVWFVGGNVLCEVVSWEVGISKSRSGGNRDLLVWFDQGLT